MRAYLKKMLSLFTAGAMTLSALPFVSATPAAVASAADISSMTAKEIAADMGVGWNLGNSLDAKGGSGLNTETSWGNPMVTKDLINAVKAKGFTTIRVPVTWYKHVDSGNTINKQWMARVKEVVDWCIDDNTYVILDIHHEEDNWLKPTNAKYDSASARLKDFWTQIATEFKDYDRHLIFEGMNEPRNTSKTNQWNGGDKENRDVINKLNKDFVKTVRATGGNNKTRCLMVPTHAASPNTIAMNAFEHPAPNDPNIMVSVHCYSPYQFAMVPDPSFANWTSYDNNVKNDLQNVFNDIKRYLLDKGYAVVIGEFGATNKHNGNARVKWAEQFAEWTATNKVPIVIWDNGVASSSNNNEAYGLIDRYSYKWHSESEPMIDKLINTYTGILPRKINIGACKVTLSDYEYLYDGNRHVPAVTVTYNGVTLAENADYTVSCDGGTEVGEYYVTINGKGDYDGSRRVRFIVSPSDLSAYKLGDVNFDGRINSADIVALASHVKGVDKLSIGAQKAADVNEDSRVDINDIIALAAHVKGIEFIPDKFLS